MIFFEYSFPKLKSCKTLTALLFLFRLRLLEKTKVNNLKTLIDSPAPLIVKKIRYSDKKTTYRVKTQQKEVFFRNLFCIYKRVMKFFSYVKDGFYFIPVEIQVSLLPGLARSEIYGLS